MSQQNYSPVNVYPGAPPAGDILTGSLDASTGTLITIPAGRTWQGSCVVNVTTLNTSTAATVDGAIYINVVGAGATPAAGVLLETWASAGVSGAGGVPASQATNSAFLGPVYVNASSTGSVTLTLSKFVSTKFTGSVAGILL